MHRLYGQGRLGASYINLIYNNFLKGYSLIEQENILDRTDCGIISWLYNLSKEYPQKWLPVYQFYLSQYYNKPSTKTIVGIKRYTRRPKKKVLEYNYNKAYNKEYFRTFLKKRPYKIFGKKIKKCVVFLYGDRRGNLKDFVQDLIKNRIIKYPLTPYLWVRGYRRPSKCSLDKIIKLFKKKNRKVIGLENLLHLN